MITKQEARIIELEHTVEQLREMFDDILWDDDARMEYRKIAKEIDEELKEK